MKILSLNKTALAVASASAAMMLVACGDSGGLPGANQPPQASIFVDGTEVPLTSTASAVGATDFIKSIVAAGGNESNDPLVDGNALLAASESDDPDPTI